VAYTYLLDLYQALSSRKTAIKKQLTKTDNSADTTQYKRGQLDVIEEFSHYLRENFHSKLPRRMQ